LHVVGCRRRLGHLQPRELPGEEEAGCHAPGTLPDRAGAWWTGEPERRVTGTAWIVC
jgi:hypothetical protein